MHLKHEDTDFAAFHAADGSRIEIFGPKTGWGEEHRHFDSGPVGGFEVENIEGGRELLVRNNIELLGDLQGTPGRTQWQHFRGPDGNVYEIVHHPDLHSGSKR